MSALEREEISRGLVLGHGVRAIARRIGRIPSSVSREVRRNVDHCNRYRATSAQLRAQRRAQVARRPRKLGEPWLSQHVSGRLAAGWSPQQIAARLQPDYPHDVSKRISHHLCRDLYRPAR